MKKIITPLLFFLFTLIFCISLNPVTEVFKTYEKASMKIKPYGNSGCELICKNKKGIIKKYVSNDVNCNCTSAFYDFNGDGIDEVYISDGKNFEIIDFSKNIPMKISKKEDFSPLNLSFVKNENSITAYLDNGQSFEIFPENLNLPLNIEKNADISIKNLNNDKIYEICITQTIKNTAGKNLYIVETYKKLKENYFTISDIKVNAI